MPIVPDIKDWTWVLARSCPECGFDASTLANDQISSLIRANAQRWQPILAQPAERLRRRTRDDRWSRLEYACHVRDVFRLYQQRLQLMLTEDNPMFPNWDQDRTAVADDYNAQDPAAVAVQLSEAAEAIAAAFDTVAGSMWDRRGRRSDGADFSVSTFARYFIHDPVHHLRDVMVDG